MIKLILLILLFYIAFLFIRFIFRLTRMVKRVQDTIRPDSTPPSAYRHSEIEDAEFEEIRPSSPKPKDQEASGETSH